MSSSVVHDSLLLRNYFYALSVFLLECLRVYRQQVKQAQHELLPTIIHIYPCMIILSMTSMKKNSIESLVESILQQQPLSRWNRDHNYHDTGGDVVDDNNDPQHHHKPGQQQFRPYSLLLQHTQSFMSRYDTNNNSNQSTANRQQRQHHQPWLLQSGEIWLEYFATLLLQHSLPHTTSTHRKDIHQPSIHSQQQQKQSITTSTQSLQESRRGGNFGINVATTTKSNNNNHNIIFITTLPITSTSTIKILQDKYDTQRVQNISCCCSDCPGNVMYDNEQQNNSLPQQPEHGLERLDTILLAVKNRLLSSTTATATTTTVMIDSMTPILMRHGYTKTIQFIHQLIGCSSSSNNNNAPYNNKLVFVILPIRMEMLTPIQHKSLEQTIQFDAILNTVHQQIPQPQYQLHNNNNNNNNNNNHGYTALLIRRGVQVGRRDYIRRDIVPYHVITVNRDNDSNNSNNDFKILDTTTKSLVSVTRTNNNNNTSLRRYCIDCTVVHDKIIAPQLLDVANDNSMLIGVGSKISPSLSVTNEDSGVQPPSYSKNSSYGNRYIDGTTKRNNTSIVAVGAAVVNLQLDDGTRRGITTTNSNLTTKNDIRVQHKPNIYLEETDPDFYNNNDDDYDEDEPDDDLDL